MDSNITKVQDWDNIFIPVACNKLIPFAVYSVILFIIGLISNPILIWTILKYKELKTPINILILTLSILNTIGIVIELPLVGLSAALCK